jgi:acetylglutamate kinase
MAANLLQPAAIREEQKMTLSDPTELPNIEDAGQPATQRYSVVIKVGGNELDDPAFLEGLALAVRNLQDDKKAPVIVHGGGKTIAYYQEQLGLTPQFVEGLRVTDDASMDVAEMVLSGLANKRVVRTLVGAGIRAAGISGVDDGTIYVEKMWHPLGDLGRVGEIKDMDLFLLTTLLDAGFVPVVSPISYGKLDNLSYNVNADHAATALAAKLGAIRLIFVSNVPGILVAGRVVRAVTAAQAENWIDEELITGGMIPKVRSALHAVQNGVAQAVITNLAGLQEGGGTAVLGNA